MGGDGEAGLGAVLRLDYGLELGWGYFLEADFYEGADDCADHVAQETVGGDCEYEVGALLLPVGLCDFAVEGADVCVDF